MTLIMTDSKTESNSSSPKISSDIKFDRIDAIDLGTPLSDLRQKGFLCDICIKITEDSSETIFYAHKIILVAASPYFQTLFHEDRLHDQVALPSCVKSTAFSMILGCIYGKGISLSNVFDRQGCLPTKTLLDNLLSTASLLGLLRVASQLSNWTFGNLPDVKIITDDTQKVKMEEIISEEPELRKDKTLVQMMADDALNCRLSVQLERIDAASVGLLFQQKGLPKLCQDSNTSLGKRRGRPRKDKCKKLLKASTNDAFKNNSPRKKITDGSPLVKKKTSWLNVKNGEEATVKTFEKLTNALSDPNKAPMDLGDGAQGVSSILIEKAKDSLLKEEPNGSLSSSALSSFVPEKEQSSLDGCSTMESDEDTISERSKGMKDAAKEGCHEDNIADTFRAKPDESNEYETISKEEMKKLFTNPRDQLYIGKKRIVHELDSVKGNIDSWHRATEHLEPLLGKVIPYSNRAKTTEKVGNVVKRIKGEIRGNIHDEAIELKLKTGNHQFSVKSDKKKGTAHCPFCDVVVSTGLISWGNHFLNNHDYLWVDQALICNLCDFIHMSGQKMKDHLIVFHGIIEDASGGDCRQCGKTFLTRCRLREHSCEPQKKNVKKYHYQPLVCGTCGEKWASSIGLENHMSKAHGVPYRFNCEQPACQYSTNVRSRYAEHLFHIHKINVGEGKVLSCPNCDYTTTLSACLKKHVLIHTSKDYSFKCTNAGCSSAFRQRRHLQKHRLICGVDLKLPCKHCDGTFATKIKLKRHEKMMHTDRVRNYKCGYCDHAAVARENCKLHIKSCHKGNAMIVIDLRKSGLPPLPI